MLSAPNAPPWSVNWTCRMASKFDGMINPDVATRVTDLARSYQNAEPFRHIVIDDFLNEQFAGALLSQFPAFERGNNLGDDGAPGKKSTFEQISRLGGAYQALDRLIQQKEFLELVGGITGIDGLLYDPFYLGGGTHENRSGQSLHPHVDFNRHPSEGWHRRLNLIVYLNPGWNEDWGGDLELYRDPYQDPQPIVKISPLFNRCVIFGTTEESWHAFNQISIPAELANLTRKSIALYFYSTDRPAEEVAGKHTTHYVNRQIPDHIIAGHTLAPNDIELLRGIVADRDNLLRRLYTENSELRQAQDRGLSGKLIYLLKRYYVRFRK
jgi:hypothetical protein